MYLPSLYSSANSISVKSVAHIFNKYGHLLKFKKNEAILDIGTGDGRTTIETLLPRLPKDLKEFIASDKSIHMIKYAQNVKEFQKIPIIELDVEAKTIPEELQNRFDHIFTSLMFHFVKNSRQGLQNIYSMLKPEGEVFGVFLSETLGDKAWYKLSKDSRWTKYDPNPYISPYYQNPNVVEIFEQHLIESGFKNCYLQLDDYHYDFKSNKEFRDLLTSVNLSVEKIPEKYLEDYLEEYFNHAKNSNVFYVKKAKNGEILPPTAIVRLLTFYGQKL